MAGALACTTLGLQATSGSYGRDQTSAANVEDTQAGAQMMLTVYPLRSV